MLARATPAMISKVRACLRTSIFVRRSYARTNARVESGAPRYCIVGSLSQLAYRLTRTSQCKRRKLIKSASSSSTLCSGSTKRREQPLLRIWSQWVKIRRIHSFVASLWEEPCSAGWAKCSRRRPRTFTQSTDACAAWALARHRIIDQRVETRSVKVRAVLKIAVTLQRAVTSPSCCCLC